VDLSGEGFAVATNTSNLDRKVRKPFPKGRKENQAKELTHLLETGNCFRLDAFYWSAAIQQLSRPLCFWPEIEVQAEKSVGNDGACKGYIWPGGAGTAWTSSAT
jgi:hypothetical protein